MFGLVKCVVRNFFTVHYCVKWSTSVSYRCIKLLSRGAEYVRYFLVLLPHKFTKPSADSLCMEGTSILNSVIYQKRGLVFTTNHSHWKCHNHNGNGIYFLSNNTPCISVPNYFYASLDRPYGVHWKLQILVLKAMGFSLKNTVQPGLKLNNIQNQCSYVVLMSWNSWWNQFILIQFEYIFIPEPYKHWWKRKRVSVDLGAEHNGSRESAAQCHTGHHSWSTINTCWLNQPVMSGSARSLIELDVKTLNINRICGKV